MVGLHSLGEIEDDVLFHTCGIKSTMDFIIKLVDLLPSILHATTLPMDTPCLKPIKFYLFNFFFFLSSYLFS